MNTLMGLVCNKSFKACLSRHNIKRLSQDLGLAEVFQQLVLGRLSEFQA